MRSVALYFQIVKFNFSKIFYHKNIQKSIKNVKKNDLF